MNTATHHIEKTLLRQRALRSAMFVRFSELSVRLASFDLVQETLADELDRVDAQLQIVQGQMEDIT